MLNTSLDTNNLYSRFNNNTISSNKAYLSNAYGKNNFYTSNNDVQYYNAQTPESANKTKKSRKKAIAISIAAGLTFAGALIQAFRHKSVFVSQFSALKKTAKDLNLLERITSGTSNFTNVKDDAFGRFVLDKIENIPILKYVKKGADKLSAGYRIPVRHSFKTQYNAIIERLKKYPETQGMGRTFEDADELFDKVDKFVGEAVSGDRRITIGIMGNDKGIKNKVINFFNNMTSGNLADKRIAEYKNGNGEGIFDIVKLLKDIPDNASEDFKKDAKALNNLFTEALIPKARDLNCGQAPTDVITILTPLAALGVGVHNAESKEEKQSIMLDVGFPLIGTVMMPVVGLFYPVLNGFKGMVAGLAVGQVFSNTAKIIGKVTKNNQDKNNKQIA